MPTNRATDSTFWCPRTTVRLQKLAKPDTCPGPSQLLQAYGVIERFEQPHFTSCTADSTPRNEPRYVLSSE